MMDGLNRNRHVIFVFMLVLQLDLLVCWVSMVRRNGTRRTGRGKCLLPRQPSTNESKNGGSLFRRPKLTLSCSAEGKEGSSLFILWLCQYLWLRLYRPNYWTSELLTGEDLEGSGIGLGEVLSLHLPKEKTTVSLSQDGWCHGRSLIWAHL
jgi:hypothetical protein